MPADLLHKVRVASAGTYAGDGLPAEPNAVQVMNEFNVDLSNHRSRMIQPQIVAGADLILIMETLHGTDIRDFANNDTNPIRLLGAFGGQDGIGEIPDPYGGDPERYRQTALQIQSCLEGVIGHVRQALSG